VALAQFKSAGKPLIYVASEGICGKSGLETKAFGLVCLFLAAFSQKNL
jgi:hypothetical protein